MPDFWENTLRFPRFFISSMIGLVFTIVGPFLNLLQRPQTTVIFIMALITLILFLSLTLNAMIS
nr:photosystem I assembly protein Ycf33 [Chroomonas debatzensis]